MNVVFDLGGVVFDWQADALVRRVFKIKPESAIYEHLLAEHRLEPTETVFIDDISENLAAATTFGIRTIQFIDPGQCRADLAILDCL
ncbi:MAG: HAD-IA family hydrolase [Gammaproteobacteria bacterium]|nr:HAD-IA family hydrolase [Gammaproteobacteria bacterium]